MGEDYIRKKRVWEESLIYQIIEINVNICAFGDISFVPRVSFGCVGRGHFK